MNFLDTFLKLPIAEQIKVMNRLKAWTKNRDEMFMQRGADIFKEHTTSIKKESGWTDGKTMKKKFSIPMDVYMANFKYWDEIIKTKQFSKHPEWVVGK